MLILVEEEFCGGVGDDRDGRTCNHRVDDVLVVPTTITTMAVLMVLIIYTLSDSLIGLIVGGGYIPSPSPPSQSVMKVSLLQPKSNNE